MKKILCLLVITLSLCACSNEESQKNTNVSNNEMTVHYIDVGNADATLYKSNNCNILIDAGTNEEGNNVVNYLKENNITELNYVVGTHPHEDHIGGLDDVINNIKVDNIYLPDKTHTSKTFESVIDAIEKHNLSINIPKDNEEIKCGNINMKFLGPKENKDYGKNLNAWSIVTKINFGDTSFLSAGDMDFQAETDLLASKQDLTSNVFKVNHHGSNNHTNSEELLNKINPNIAIISTGQPNSYGHPHQETIDRLNTLNIKIYRTDEVGTIVLKTNGTSVTKEN